MANPSMAAAKRSLPADSSHLFSSFTTQELYDWWLIKVETGAGGKQLGVAGFTYTEGNDARFFYSTAIAVRHDIVTLQTVDGITILLTGFINRSQTLLNGFSSEVCSQFLLGFPYNWEEFASVSFGKSTNKDAAFNISGFLESIKGEADGRSSSTMSVDHLPTNILRDILMSRIGDSEGILRKSILGEIVHKYSNKAFNADEGSCLNQKSGTQVTTGDLSFDVTSSQKKKAKANQNLEDNNDVLDANSGNNELEKASPEVIPRVVDMSGGNASITSEPFCLDKKSINQVTIRGPSLEETPIEKKKAADNLRREDESHMPDTLCRKEVFQRSKHKNRAGIDLSSGPLTRGKASLYKKTTVNQKQEEKRYVCNAESGQVDSKIVNGNSSSGPLTRSKARYMNYSETLCKTGCAD